MIIAFWGGSVHSGTGANMRAVAAAFSGLYPDIHVGMYRAGEKGRSIRRNKNYKYSKKTEKSETVSAGAAAGIRFVDCGSGMDEEKRRMLRKAEIVVVNLRQEEKELRQFFLEEAYLLPDSPILIGNYCVGSKFSRRYLECVYRTAPERVSVLSRNAEFEYAAARGGTYQFVKKELCAPENPRNQQLLEELRSISIRLRQKAEALYGGSMSQNRSDNYRK